MNHVLLLFFALSVLFLLYIITLKLDSILRVLCAQTPDVYDEMPDVHEQHATPEVQPDLSDLTEHERITLQREMDFDERIKRIKDELANEVANTRTYTLEPAQELHPNVKNLPHNIIKDYTTLPDVEISE